MRVLVLGATGRTGRSVVRAARAAGHEVTALVRDPTRLESTDGVRVLTGDATDEHDMTVAVAGQEAVISALGSRSMLRSDIATPSAKLLVPLAQAASVRRIIVMSAFGIGETRDQSSPLVRAAFSTVLRSLSRDKTVADDIVRRSGLDWTIVHPVTLTDDPPTGRVIATSRLAGGSAATVSRADVAGFKVDGLASEEWSRQTVVLHGPSSS